MANPSDDIKKLDKTYRGLVGQTAYDNKSNVTVKNITRDYSDKFDTVQICFLSDTHIGSSDFDIKGLIDNLTYADSQENAILFLLGDGLNTAIIGSKSDPYEDILSPQQELDIFSDILKIAKGDRKLARVLKSLDDSGKIVVLHSGNHEDRITRAVGISATKVAADIAGVGASYAPFYANTDLVLRQPLAKDGKFHFGVVTHHGTGIRNIDGTFRLLRNVDNADMCVIGHTHQYAMKTDRLIKVDENGDQVYHDVICMSLPASGGGTYGAGMALPDIFKQTAVWVAVSSQVNPQAGKISPTGIRQPEIIPACAFFSPTNSLNTHIKAKRVSQAGRVIREYARHNDDEVPESVDAVIEALQDSEKATWDKIIERVKERPAREPKGFAEWFAAQQALKDSENPDAESPSGNATVEELPNGATAGGDSGVDDSPVME